MKKCIIVDGEIIEITEEMVMEMENLKLIKTVTDKDRISAIESAIADLAILLANNENIKED